MEKLANLLIVDDIPENLTALGSVLEDLECNVFKATSANEALRLVVRHNFALLLLDVQMPDVNGFELAELIRGRKETGHIPIIFVTAISKEQKYVFKGYEVGAVDYLFKPIEPDILRSKVRVFLELYQQRQMVEQQAKTLEEKMEVLEAEINERKRIEKELQRHQEHLEELVKERTSELITANEKLQQEIEEHKQTESARQKTEEDYRALFESLQDVFFRVDPKGNILLVSPSIIQLLGYTQEEAAQLNLEKDILAHPAQWQEFADFISEKGYLEEFEMLLKRRDGSVVWGSTTSQLYTDKEGRILGIEGMFRDIDNRKKASEALRKLNQELQEASRHKSDFLASMSHELRTPLNAMIGYTSLTLNALQKDLPSDHLQNLKKAERSARMLLQLINDVLDFSKIEAGRMEIFIEGVELNEILEDLLITAEGLLLDKPVELQTEIDSELPTIKGDYTKMKQILNNLLGNAIKFTEEGYVAVRAKKPDIDNQHPATIRVEVEDTGAGIPQDKLNGIFESFRQIDGSIKKKFGGTGLGLAITKRLCEMLHIDIGVQSEENKGTLFWLNIPVAFQKRATDDIQQVSSESGALISGEPMLQVDFKTSILCFCDPERIASLKPQFQDFPIEFQTVTTLAECLEKVNSQPIWAILVNPEKLSAEELTKLKRDPAIRKIPVILHSPPSEASAPQAGGLQFFTNSVDKRNVMETLFQITRMQKGEILVIDDDPDARELYGVTLANAGYTPHFARNGSEALLMLSEQRLPQAIILDLMMPDMDGFQVLERIQNHKAWKQIPVIVITAQVLSPEQRKHLKEATQLLLQKGQFSVKGLSQKIDSMLNMMAPAITNSILIVDDNKENLELFENIFQKSGYQVYIAQSAQEGIEVATETVPDIILMDLAMPEIDGFEATQQLKQRPATSDITVIACSAFTTQESREKAFKVGCEGYISKPVEPNMLVDQVAKSALMSRIRKQFKASAETLDS